MSHKKLVIIGGGAAGFFCAVNAARIHPGLKVMLLEKSSKLLSKVKVSGGGRCNVTHDCDSMSEMLKRYPRGNHFLKKAFHHFFTTDTIAWFNERGVALKTEADGRMFPVTNNSQTVIDCLIREANKYAVEIWMNAGIESIEKNPGGRFILHVSNGRQQEADYVCIASGGYPKAAQFDWLTKLGHAIEPPVPSLFTFNLPKHSITELMGITVENVQVKMQGTKLQQTGPLLITHWGLSGPAVLKSSAWAARHMAEKDYRAGIVVNWLPEYHELSLREKMLTIRFSSATQKIYNRNPFGLPSRLWEYLLKQCDIKETWRWTELPAKEQNRLVKILCAHEFEVNGKTTFKEEFVTAGGIKLDEVDASTMQSRKVPGLYFAGEVLDVDGVTGGFNFQNAWTTGWIAAQLNGANDTGILTESPANI